MLLNFDKEILLSKRYDHAKIITVQNQIGLVHFLDWIEEMNHRCHEFVLLQTVALPTVILKLWNRFEHFQIYISIKVYVLFKRFT